MLRARILKRDTSSICAFCQHRLLLRLVKSRTKRQFTSTAHLGGSDGWGGWGNFSKPPAQSNPDDFLSQHELLARQQLIAKQQTKKASETPKPKPIQARYVWNTGKQREVEESLRRDGMTLPRDVPFLGRDAIRSRADAQPSRSGPPIESGSDGPFRRNNLGRSSLGTRSENWPPDGSRRPMPTRFGRDEVTTSSSVPRDRSVTQPTQQDTTPKTGSIRAGDTSNLPTNSLNRPFAETPKEVNRMSRQSDNTMYSARDRPLHSVPTQREDFGLSMLGAHRGEGLRPRANWDNTISPSRPSQGESDWGLLARKQTPKSSSEDFWATVNSRASGIDQKPNASAQTGKQPDTRDNWPSIESKVDKGAPKYDASYDWGAEFDKVETPKKDRATQRLTKENLTKVAHAPGEEKGQPRNYNDWDRDRGRDKRGDRFGPERGVSGRDSRGGRGSRFRRGPMVEEDEGGFDYDAYQEKRRLKAQRKAQREAEIAGHIPIRLPELIGIAALAKALKVKPDLFLTQLGELGFEGVTMDSLMAGETAALVAQEYGFEPTVETGQDRDLKPRPPPEDPSILPQRPPVVTIMGHVDHGKTTLLDYLRKSSIAAQEHGGITQRIGAFSVKLSSGKPITFLDTPGHAAFLTMRQRGAHVTDIVVLVVAADDSVKPQTIEAIKHARAAKVPMIVAINKIDKDGAHIDQVKHDLAQEGVELEDFGGDVQAVCVSGKTGQGMDDLEENILTLSEVLDHRAEVDGPAEGWILESSLKPIGKAATVLVKRGTLRPGDYIAADLTWAKIRHLRNEAGVDIDEAPPGTPVEILGWKDLPGAGDQVIQAPDEGRAKDAVEYREGLREREKDAAAQEVISEARRALQEKRAREKAAAAANARKDAVAAEPLAEEENGVKLINFVVKGDLHGSVEAVCAAIEELGNNEVRPRILRSVTGPIGEFDVEHAATTNSIIVNFATTTPGYVKHMAEEQGVQILDHNVIYHLVDDVKANLSKHLAPEISSRVLGEAEVLQIFPINVKGRQYKNIAGCRVRNGLVARGHLFRIFRGKEKIFDGKLETLKHLKKDVTEVRKGTECGIGFEEFQDFEVGDQIQAYEQVTTERNL
ncbi:initiation factor 2 [Hypoxylon crocopeplum]|nr:initiation factor 2 [Hypoxylon crocopeplum]